MLYRLWLWFWHLLPSNPILVRVVHGGSRRSRHMWLRAGYLGALLIVVLFSLISSMEGRSGSLSELAKGASQTFKFASMTQLALMCFLAPVFTAGAITQERDAQTFNILLSTPLTNAQIVFGSLMSRLYFVIVLLIAGLPIFLVTMVYGGVTTSQVLESFALSGSTAVLTGALAIFVAMIRVGTRGTIFSFYLLIGLYLLSIYLLGKWSVTWIEASPPNLSGAKMSWLTPLQPFLALEVALNMVYAPPYSRLGDHSGLIRYALAYPSTIYVVWTTALAFVLMLLSMLFVRRSILTGEATFFSKLFERFQRHPSEERTRPPRRVWANPVAWREAKTRSSGGGNILRWTMILGGLAASAILFIKHVGGSMSADEVRAWLAGLIIIQFAIALILATNTAATSMTKERESKTMDLLLSTPVTSKYILWGKLRGLVSMTLPLLLGPVCVLILFAWFSPVQAGSPPTVWIETGLELAGLTLVYTACACVIGLRVSLVSKKNVSAVMYSVGMMILLCGVSWILGKSLVDASRGEYGAFLAPLTPFTSIWYLVNPVKLYDTASEFAQRASAARAGAMIGTVAALCGYALVVWSIYRGLVRNFDMIVRKQSGT
ncbi:MAG: ABC transporter permease subunit [Phycisphaerales bacterium]|nr:MAG: ABC transporter permease subunit [Phycisphaerales bacterium]